VSCEKLLDDEFRHIPGVKDVRVDRLKNTGEVDYDESEPDFSEIQKVAGKFGYDARDQESDKEGDKKESSRWESLYDWIIAVTIVGTLYFLFKIFEGMGIINRIDVQDSNVTFGMALLVGLVASISSCLAVVGSVVIAFGEKYRTEEKSFYAGAVRPNLFFHAGRLATFFVLGGVLGLVGGELELDGNFVATFTIIIAVIMGWLGLNILGFVPNISSLGIHMPKGLTKNWSKLKESEHKAAPFLLGGLSFFLPCGFTQSMQIFALASGSFWIGGLTLFVFALGTLPSLLILGISASWAGKSGAAVFKKVAGILILLFALYTFQSGWALVGSGGKNSEGEESAPVAVGEQQVIEMRVTNSGFVPATLKIKRGVSVKWVIKGDQITGCTNKIIVPSLNISKPLKNGDNIVEFTPTETGTIPFSCWMGMVKGKFIVE